MALTIKEQISKTLENSTNVLIVFKKKYNADALSSALALKMILEKMDKKADILCDGFELDSYYEFLPFAQTVSGELEAVKQFKINLSLKGTPLKDFSYNVEGDNLSIYLTPKKGMFTKEDITTHDGSYRYDLIVAVDTEDLESLGELFHTHSDFFYQTTILNIDHKPENENFGQINHVDLNATSTAELLYRLLEDIDPELAMIDGNIAQCLLCGIIAKTRSFKSIKVTPTTLHIASRLMKAGADRDEIVKNLYYTKSISTLKLWGKVLARLKSDPTTKMAWSFLEEKDFTELDTTPDKINNVIEELIMTAPEAKIITIFYEYKGKIHGIMYSDTSYSSKELVQQYDAFGSSRLANFSLTADDLIQTGKRIIDEVKVKVS